MIVEPPADNREGLPPKRATPFQWNLRTLFLLTAAVAAWLTHFHYQAAAPRLKQKVHLMGQVAPELVVDHPHRIAVLRLPATWRNNHGWEIHLPAGQYRLRLATREIGKSGLAPVVGEAKLSAGRHHIELQFSGDKQEPKLAVLVDGRFVIDVTETPDWGILLQHSWEGGSDRPPDEPVVLFRGNSGPNTAAAPLNLPGNGILLWIELVDP